MLLEHAGGNGDMKDLLIDSMPLVFALEEDAKDPKKIVIRGQFGKSGIATENKRVYREHLWRREFGRLNEAMQNRRVFGELDHPADGRTKLQRVSHLITNLTINGDDVIGEAEVLDTPNGRIMKALAAAKAQVGVSSRGYGSTKTLPDGSLEVQEDFRLDTFDFVADPASKGAYPKVFSEERSIIEEAEMDLTLERLKQYYPGLVGELSTQILHESGSDVTRAIVEAEERTERRLTDVFAENLRRSIEVIDEEARASVRSELMSDPEVAGAKQVLEQIVSMVRSYGIDPQASEDLADRDTQIEDLKTKLADRELELQRYKAEAEEMKKLAKEAAYTLHMERAIGGHPSREAIEALLGDVTQYSTKEELGEKIDTLMNELDRRVGPIQSEDDDDDADDKDETIAELAARVEDLEQDLDKARAAKKSANARVEQAESNARKAVEIAEALETKLYAERKIGEYPHKDRDTLRGLCENAMDEHAIDRIVEGYVPQRTVDSDEADRIRARLHRGKPRDLYEDTHGRQRRGPSNGRGSSPLEEVGLNTNEFIKLAGTGNGA